MKKAIIIGAGRFGYSVANRLSELGSEVMVIDTNEKRLSVLKGLVSQTIIMNAVDRDALSEKIANRNFDAGVVGIGDDFSTALLIVLYLKQFGIPYVVARASNPRQGVIMKKIGVDIVVTPEDDMGHQLAEKLILADSEQIDLSPDTSIIKVLTPEVLVGKPIKEIDFSQKGFRFLFAGRRYTDQGFVKLAYPEDEEFEISEGDFLVFVGDTRRVAKTMEELRD